MEKRLNTKFEAYITEFKNSIRDKINKLKFTETEKIGELVGFVYDYERLVFEKDDVCKRKRIKNSVPVLNRCNAKRANGEQCTRRRADDCEFCGTHVKGTPHGLICHPGMIDPIKRKVDVMAHEICGIVYYIDDFNNVYSTEDVMSEKENPKIIARYEKHHGVYTIPEFGLV
jgi:hypothetical protein